MMYAAEVPLLKPNKTVVLTFFRCDLAEKRTAVKMPSILSAYGASLEKQELSEI